MKKLLFGAYSLELGGIEISLVTLLNSLVDKYDITLILEQKQGILLNNLSNKIKIIEYKPSNFKNLIYRKIVNLTNRLKFIIKYKNKFDFAGSYATYSIPASFCARMASKNNALWVHSNYLDKNNGDIEKTINFFEEVKYRKFKKIICISNNTATALKQILNFNSENIIATNNIIDYKKVIEQTKKNINLKKSSEITFLNIARHDEESKKLAKLIEASKLLKENNYKFKVLLVGDGKDNQMYKNLVTKYNLEKEIIFCGEQKNPYPYYNLCNCLILTSDYEGYPVVFLEAKILNKPIITTDVSDAKEDIDGIYGIVTTKNIDDIYNVMKNFIENGFTIKEKFNPEEFNKKILEQIEKLF